MNQQPGNYPINNDRSLQQLAWAIQASLGQFKLILARCNYPSLRDRLIARLTEISQVKIEVLSLQHSTKNLYGAMREETGRGVQVLMIIGLESVSELSSTLIGANQMRDNFRQDFPLPLVWWVDDRVYQQMMELAPDLESWATTRNFAITPTELIDFLSQTVEELFAGNLTLTWEKCEEIKWVWQGLQDGEQVLEPELKASGEYLLGLVEYSTNQLEKAINYYQSSLAFWQSSNHLERQVQTLQYLTLCYYGQTREQETQNHLHQALAILDTANRPHLIADAVEKIGVILRHFQDWQQLESLVEIALPVHQAQGNQIKVAQDYSFLAEVALARENWQEAEDWGQRAWVILSHLEPREIITPSQRVLLILSQARQKLGNNQVAVENLQAARKLGVVAQEPQLYIDVLHELHDLLFQQKQYPLAFDTKLERRSIEQQFGLRAFIGAGWLQATKQVAVETLTQVKENIAPEIDASSRMLDVERLIQRIARPDYKLIVICGQSGVGKSSLVNAGLIPALKKKAIGIQDNLPVMMRVYTDWVSDLGKLVDGGGVEDTILQKLRENEQRQLRTVLIFDQFEEFFFVYPEAKQRRQFFEFLGECLNILPLKVILSLRVDYIHYLLEANDLPSMTIIGNDILSSNVLYRLGNFSPADAQSIIERLTTAARFHLEPALIEQLVQDLAGDLGEVRPIELQIVGAQLQRENITTLTKYRESGTKVELVQRYLDEVVNDCGEENQQAGKLLLYLLTDERGTRPLKTRAELEQDLKELAKNTADLDLILGIFVRSGLVMLLPDHPADRYQLVHDYIAAFVRQQQEPRLNQVMAELERERQQRKISEANLSRFLKCSLVVSVAVLLALAGLALLSVMEAWEANQQKQQAQINEINALANSSDADLASGDTANALIEALRVVKKLEHTPAQKMLAVTTLQQAVYLRPDEKPENRTIEVNTLEGHSSYVNSVSFSPDGKTLASGSVDKTIKLWDVSTGKLLKTLSGHSNEVNSVSFSPDGKTLASGSLDNTIKLWDVSTGKLLKTLSGHSNEVRSVSFSPNGKTLASGSGDNTIKLWDVSTGKLLKTLSGGNYVYSVSFSPDGKTLASGSFDKTIKLWDVSTGKLLKTLSGHSNDVSSVSFSPDGKTLASGSVDKTIKLWDVSTGKLLKTLSGHSSYVHSVSFSPDGKTLASGSGDKTIKLWDVSTGKLLKTLSGHSNSVRSVSFSPDGKTLASGSGDNTIKLWDVSTGKLLKTLSGHSNSIRSVSFSPDGKTLASGSVDKTIKLWDVSTGKLLKTLIGHSSYVNSVSFSPDGKTLASGSFDKTIKLWDVSTGKLLKTLSGHSNPVFSVSFSPDGKTLASGSFDKTIKLWDVSTGKLLKTLSGHSNLVHSVSFSPDDKTLASGSFDKTIKLWDVSTGTLLKTLSGHINEVSSVSFSPDGKTLASGSFDNTIKLWDVSTGKLLKTLSGHSNLVYSVSFSPDGKTLASGSLDKTIKLWDVSTGTLLKTLSGHSSEVYSISFSPDGKTLASGSLDKTIILWDLDLDRLVRDGCQLLDPYLITHPEVLEELKDCQTPSLLRQAATVLVSQGEKLARSDNTDDAVKNFRTAQGWDTSLKFDPQVKAQEFADKGKAERLIADGKTIVKQGQVKQALQDYTDAHKLDPQVEISADDWNSLCWGGSLYKQAADVMFACDKAVALAPDDGDVHSSRGLARVLTGDTKGAIKDFEVYIAQTEDKELKSQLQDWVKTLHAGKNPFTEAVLQKLREQYFKS